jgi:hypothetical protein
MSEVSEFLSRNPDMHPEFREFAAQYETLADVWKNCPRSHWMLLILRRQNYRKGEKLEGYIDWLSEQIDDANEAELERMRQTHFNYKGYAKKLEKEEEAKKLSPSEARRLRSIWMCDVAEDATRFVLDNKTAKAQFDKHTEKFLLADVGIEVTTPEFDETGFRLDLLKKQADKLRDTVGNPFNFPGADDFYYGRGIG